MSLLSIKREIQNPVCGLLITKRKPCILDVDKKEDTELDVNNTGATEPYSFDVNKTGAT